MTDIKELIEKLHSLNDDDLSLLENVFTNSDMSNHFNALMENISIVDGKLMIKSRVANQLLQREYKISQSVIDDCLGDLD